MSDNIKLAWQKDNNFTYQIDETSITYLIYNNVTNLYKIGITGSLRDRIRNLETASGIKLSLVGFIQSAKHIDICAKSIEFFLHKYFKEKRKLGEWFNLSKRDLIELKSFTYYVEVDYISF